jgi:hypothetical protein
MGDVSAPGPTAVAPADPRRPWQPPPFTRLARTHALSVAGDTLFTAAMAGTVFFSVGDFDEARGRVALLLLFTIAPFAVAAPLLGPMVDRIPGGRRWMIVGIAVARAVLCLLILRDRDSLWFYMEALAFLVLSKGYLIARAAVVPTTVRNDAELVKANARIALLSGVVTVVVALPAAAFIAFDVPSWLLVPAAFIFIGAAVTAVQLPAARVAPAPPDAVERAELRSVGILVAASSIAALRFTVGFLVFQIGFYAKENGQGLLMVAAAVAGQAGFLAGSMVSPVLRRSFSEERILAIMLAGTVAGGVLASLIGAVSAGSAVMVGLAAALLSFAVGVTSNVGKQAFDAIVQRDAPDANRGRSFARFETRFQLVWVVGALVPTATAALLPMEVAYVVVSAVASFALLSFLIGRQRASVGRDHRLVRFPRPAEVAMRVWDRRGDRGDAGDAGDAVDAVDGRAPRSTPAPVGGLTVPDLADDPAVTRFAVDDLPEPVSLPPMPPSPPGGLFDGDSDGVPDGPQREAIFSADAPIQAPPTLDPRRVLDPAVAFDQTGVRPPSYLGFMSDEAPPSDHDTDGATRRNRHGRSRRAAGEASPRRRRRQRPKPGPSLFDN